MFINLNLFSIQEDDYNDYKDVFLLNHARQKVKFYPCSYLISHSLLMEYNTFNSWEPHGEREKRIINVTFAAVVLPSRHPPSWSSKFKPDTFIIITKHLIYVQNQATLCATIINDKSFWSLLFLLMVLEFIIFLLLCHFCLLSCVMNNIIHIVNISDFLPAIWPWQSSSQTGHIHRPLSFFLMHHFLQSWHK